MNFIKKRESKIKKYIALVLLCIFSLLTIATAAGYSFGYNLYVNERYIGSFVSLEKAEEIIEILKAEDGIDVSSGKEIVFGLMMRESFTSVDEACENYRMGDSKYTEGYVFTYGGKDVFFVRTAEEANAVADEILALYDEEEAERNNFTKKTAIEKRYILNERFVEKEEALILLSEIADVETIIIDGKTEVIPFETEIIETDELYSGCNKVVSEGADGELYVEKTTLKINGEIISEYVSDKYAVTEMQKRVIKKGTKPAPEGITTGKFINPTTGVLTSPFGKRWGRMHKGIDISDAEGTFICAADGGRVTYSGWMDGYGYVIQIEHENGFETYYAHCRKLCAEEGEYVTQGQRIAEMGSTGRSTGTHLHFEIRVGGEAVDPLGYVNY